MAAPHYKKDDEMGLPDIKVDVKTPPSSGGLANWGPIFGWFASLFKKRHSDKKSHD